MYSINALAVVAILGLTRSIFALPQDASAAAAVPADPISKYTVDVSTSDQGRVVVGFVNNIYQFFLNNVKTPPTASSCVFYTTGLTTEAQEFAARQVKFTIWVSLLGHLLCCQPFQSKQFQADTLHSLERLGL